MKVVRKAPKWTITATGTMNPIIALTVEAIGEIHCEPKITTPRHYAVSPAVRPGAVSAMASVTAPSARG
jgi:hypothetical protein